MENTPLLSPLFLGGHPLLDPLRRASSLKPLYQSAIVSDPPLPPSPSLDPWPSSCPDPLNFQVDDLLDFSHTDEEDTGEQEASALTQEEQEQETAPGCPAEGTDNTEKNSPEAFLLPQVVACQPTSSGLCAPPDELADQLEWLSAFTEDSSYSGHSTLVSLASAGCLSSHPDSTSCTIKVQDTFQTSSPVSVLETSCSSYSNSSVIAPTAVRSRARSKRSRTGGRIWSLDTLMPTLVENRLGGAQENTVFIDGGCSRETELCHPVYEELHHMPSKKAKKPPSNTHKGLSQSDASPPRRCSHCLVQKTPQWRAGPLGPKTLCNACGVRYKSGRLLPEYRPASSPTFVSEVHSNSHKRVLEMRRLKELEAQEVLVKNEDTSAQEDLDDLYEVHMPEDEEAHSQSYPYRGHSFSEKQESFSAYDDDDDDEDDEDQQSRLEIGRPNHSSMVIVEEEPKEESISSSD